MRTLLLFGLFLLLRMKTYAYVGIRTARWRHALNYFENDRKFLIRASVQIIFVI